MSNLNLPVLLRALRKAQRLTQPQMAQRMCVDERTYRDWERGKTSPSVQHLEALATSFHRSLPDLLQVDPETGEFLPTVLPEKEGDADRITAALLDEPSIPQYIKNLILNTIRKVLRGGWGSEHLTKTPKALPL